MRLNTPKDKKSWDKRLLIRQMWVPRSWEKLSGHSIPSTPWCGGSTRWTRISAGAGRMRPEINNQIKDSGGDTADRGTDEWLFTMKQLMIGDRVTFLRIWKIIDWLEQTNFAFFGMHENLNILSNTCSLYKHFPHTFLCVLCQVIRMGPLRA